MKRARITELAESDLAKIWLYIGHDNPDAADRLIDKLRVQCQRLATSPYRGRPRPELAMDLRSYRLGNYFIFYFPTDVGIEVARVLHGARDLPRIFSDHRFLSVYRFLSPIFLDTVPAEPV